MTTSREIRKAIGDYETTRGFSFIFTVYASAAAVLPTAPFTLLISNHLLLMVIWLVFTVLIFGAMANFPKLAIGVAIASTCLIGYYFSWDVYLEKGFTEAIARFLMICFISLIVHRLAIKDLESI